jgi:predicted hotdog family 3-hydroxylacyl-ACP dehydratase
MIQNYTIDDLIPHRDRMKLVQEVLEADAKSAVTAATVNDAWPTYADGSVSPVVVVELTAQTAGVSVGLDELERNNKKVAGKGWIVGIKRASFLVDRIPAGSRIITRAWERVAHNDYAEIEGAASVEGNPVGTVILQVMRTDMEFDLGFTDGIPQGE